VAKYKVALLGAKGRMGCEIARLIKENSRLTVEYEVDQDTVLDAKRFSQCDLMIDFTVAPALEQNLQFLLENKISLPLVSGTTGLSSDGQQLVESYRQVAAVIHESNMSLGVNLLFSLVDRYSPILKEHGFAPSMVETHHVHKKDSPSGTAVTLFEVMDQHFKQATGFTKDQIVSHRMGEVVGEHTINFSSAGEDITISHGAKERSIFAQGAVVAASWIVGKAAGGYSMREVLGV
jgi:4-hydroxy-tetrahydrodipicolinate reductase